LAVWVKPSAGLITPFILLCLVTLPIRQGAKWKPVLLSLGIFLVVLVVGVEEYFRSNLRAYGVAVPLQEVIGNHRNGITMRDYLGLLRPSRWKNWVELWRLWLIREGLWVGGWSCLLPPQTYITLYTYGLFAAVFGWPAAWLFRQESFRRAGVFKSRSTGLLMIFLFLCVLGGMMLHSMQSTFFNGMSTTVPWYAAVGMPWLMAVVGASAIAWRRTRVCYAVALFTPVLFVIAEFGNEWNRMIRNYSHESPGLDALRRLATLHPPVLGTLTLMMSWAGAILAIAGALYLWMKGCAMPKENIPA
jgi:hypothetical protein